jgi:LDH2 family malate/lactate/ureidoglycolate dehydrogenase
MKVKSTGGCMCRRGVARSSNRTPTEVEIPCEVEYRREQERHENGVEVDNKTWKAFGDLAAKYGKEGLVG